MKMLEDCTESARHHEKVRFAHVEPTRRSCHECTFPSRSSLISVSLGLGTNVIELDQTKVTDIAGHLARVETGVVLLSLFLRDGWKEEY